MPGRIPSDTPAALRAFSVAHTPAHLGQLCLKGSRPGSPGTTPGATGPQTAVLADFSDMHPSQQTGTANLLCLRDKKMFSKPGTGAQESRLLLKRRAAFSFTKQELGGSWRSIRPELVFTLGTILWWGQMLYLVSCLCKWNQSHGSFWRERRREERRKEKREKERKERRQKNRWGAPWFGKLHAQHRFRLNLSAELLVFPVFPCCFLHYDLKVIAGKLSVFCFFTVVFT